MTERKDATDATRQANAAVAAALPLDDPGDFERARKGLLAEAPVQVLHEGGFPVWDRADFAFLDDEVPPDTVNPSLWRQARLNAIAGLFEIAPRFYQVRGLDLSNITLIEGETGWVVIDPLTSAETAAAALALANEHLGERAVRAVIYTHSHIDHFAGVRGVVDEADVASGAVPIVAPEGFLEAAISENVIAGNVMLRRGSYMYGPLLPTDAQGHVDAGLGKGVPLFGTNGLIAPTISISETGTELVLDGVRLVFQVTPGTEAPAEMNFYFPDHRVLCMAENCTATQHNLYTLRGAQVRDSLAWSTYIHEAIELFAADADVVFASHHWPRWGTDDGLDYLRAQRDAYRYLHDQTMRLANHGLTPLEIAEELAMPDSLESEFHTRGYYGTVNHNAKAVYQYYLGWFDGNPAHLHGHPPVEAARRYVEFMGGADEVVRKARASFDSGDFRWVAEVVNHVVFAEPDHAEAKALQADALEQLGYQAESGPWRDFYLTGAQELRQGHPAGGAAAGAGPDVLAAMTTEMLLHLVGVRLNGPAASTRDVALRLVITDRGERWDIGVGNGALHHSLAGVLERAPDATLSLPYPAFAALAGGNQTLDQLVESGEAAVEGDREALDHLTENLDHFSFGFPIVTP